MNPCETLLLAISPRDVITILCSLGGFFGWFGVAHHTRLRGPAVLFYVLSMLFLANLLATLKGAAFAAVWLHELIICMSAITALTYAVSIDRYWQRHL